MTTAPTNLATGLPVEDVEIVDVWSRAATKYRVRAALMLLLLCILFAGLCCFTFWLRTGIYTPWSSATFHDILVRSFTPWDSEQITLVDFLTRPIPVQEVPVHAVIMGLQLASLCSIPILIAILYRLPASVPFCAMIVLLAAMPWLGITIQFGCILACVGPFRFKFRYASALIALIPISLYFISASLQPDDSPYQVMRNQALLYAPWVLALLASCVICAVALALARFINFRPGGIPPVLAVLFVIPVVLFHTYVGRHELEYRILEDDIGPGNRLRYAPIDIGQLAESQAYLQWNESEKTGVFESLKEKILQEKIRGLRTRVEQERFNAVTRCDEFLESFPTSRYVQNVLYLKGLTLDMHLDESRLARSKKAEFRADHPSPASEKTWRTIVSSFSSSMAAAPALYKSAIFDATTGKYDAAVESLDTLASRFSPQSVKVIQENRSPGWMSSVFERRDPAESLSIDPAPIIRDGLQLREMLLVCKDDAGRSLSDVFGLRIDGTDVVIQPVQLLLTFDPSHPLYRENLEGLVEAFPDSQTAGYARVLLAMGESAVPSRIRRLEQLVNELSDRKAAAKAAFYLADTLQSERKLAEAELRLKWIVENHPESCWAAQAKSELRALRFLIEAQQ